MPRPQGKAALTACRKNDEVVAQFLAMLARTTDTAELDGAVSSTGLRLARVTKMLGSGHLDAQLQDGRDAKHLPIAKSISFNGRAASKADRRNCILAGDLVILRDLHAAAKIPLALVDDIRMEFVRIGVLVPKGFFSRAGSGFGAGVADEDADVPTWEFDRSEEKAVVTAALLAASTSASAAAVCEDVSVDVDAI
jgi:hypothetical protein